MHHWHKRIILFYLVLGVAFIWIFESVAHIVIFSQDSFLDAIFFNISAHEFYTRILIIISFIFLFLVLIKNKIIMAKESEIENILNNVIPICITNTKYEIVKANESYWSIWGKPDDERRLKCYNHRPGESCRTKNCALHQVLKGADKYICESKKTYKNENRHFIVTAKPFYSPNKKIIGVIESFQDITERKKLEDEKAKLIEKLKSSLDKVKLLSGFLPICASCKKIRDDKGYWNQVESYIKNHSEAEFSHSVCPECEKKFYEELDLMKKNSSSNRIQ